MGGFYANYTLSGPSQKAVVRALAGRRAIVSPESSGCVVAYDKASDDQDQEMIASLALDLSGNLNCPVLAVLDHDDDILWYQLYEDGKLTDEPEGYRDLWRGFEKRGSSPVGRVDRPKTFWPQPVLGGWFLASSAS